MIKNIIFDFGDIFINLDKKAVFQEMAKFGFTKLTPQINSIANSYEKGLISSTEFIRKLNIIFPQATTEKIINAWNSIILDFPEYRLDFIKDLAKEKSHKLFLLSNTNALHIEKVIENMGLDRYHAFKACFHKFYLSHEINLRKPNEDIYTFVLKENNLIAEETFFIDDTKENTNTAEKIGIKSWNLLVGKEDVINLKKHL